MNIVLVTRRKGCTGMVTLSKKRIALLFLGVLTLLPVSLIYTGYQLGMTKAHSQPGELAFALQSELDSQRLRIDEAKRDAGENMNALAIKLGQLQAHIIRLNALGERLTKIAGLERGEFDFSSSPAVGGPVSAADIVGQSMSVPDFVESLNDLSVQLDNRSQQLSVLETMMMNRNLQDEVTPTGRPITRGWLSSYFGLRTDPFTGRRVHHSGVDFAGKLGSDIVSVAAGVVTFSGRRSGYGNLVEINHGKGYVTRYGHTQENLVKLGDTIKKGQVIAKMGSTGRSTGPHVHFEVMVNGRHVNPKRYIHAAR